MQRKSTFLAVTSILAVVVFMAGCAGMTAKPTEKNFKAPTVTLSHVEVQSYWGWWFYSAKVEPTSGKAGNNGAPLVLAFIFDVNNPNEFPVLMERLQFTVGFEAFDINTPSIMDTIWIPAGKTNQVRVVAVQDPGVTTGSLLVASGDQVKASGKGPMELIENWWTKIPDFAFPIHVRNGSAVFKADGIVKAVAFNATFP